MAKRGNREGTIRENVERKRWEGRIAATTDGELKRYKVVGKTRKEVVDKLRVLATRLEEGERPPTTQTVGQFLDDWATVVLPGSVAESTLQQYREIIRYYIAPNIGRKRLATLTPREVQGMIRNLTDAGKSPNTVRLARSVLRRTLRWAEAEGTVTRNVAAITFGVKVPAPPGRTMTPDEARTFLTSIQGHRLEAAWVVMLATGLRRGELLGLEWSDVNLDAKTPTLVVRQTLARLPDHGVHLSQTKTATSGRTVHLAQIAVKGLRDHRKRQAAEQLSAGAEWTARPLGADLVFRTPFGTAVDPDNFRQATYVVTEQAGIGRWSPHELRHSAASLMIAQNVPLKVVSETLGHSSIRVTADIYGHLLDDARAEAADAMDRALS